MSQDNLDRAVSALLARFRRQRPLRSGSLLVTIFGDAIVPRGGAVTLGSLIRLAQPFGLTERLVRTSVGRLAKEDWLSARRCGRQSEYALTRHGRERFTEATQRIYSEPPREWQRRWTLLMLPAAASRRRETIREEMLWLGFGQVAPGVLAHPSRTVEDTRRQLKEIGLPNHAVILNADSGGHDQDRQLISTGWDLGELARGYRRFVEVFAPIEKSLAAGAHASAECAFVIRTLLIHEYRKIHLRDPLLPHGLLPNEWIGAQAYTVCRELYRRVFAASEAFLSTHALRVSGPIAAPAREPGARFTQPSGD